MDNATLILQVLDRHLDHPVRLILYGRAALQLGFEQPPGDAAESKDVDCIVPVEDADELSGDLGFWDAQQATNTELRPKGLYITHLFRADQVFLRRDWLKHLVPIRRVSTRWLQLWRPATLDLILTKMMRGDDAQDMADVAFLLRQDKNSLAQIDAALAEAVLPDLVELREAFERATPRVRELAAKVESK